VTQSQYGSFEKKKRENLKILSVQPVANSYTEYANLARYHRNGHVKFGMPIDRSAKRCEWNGERQR